MCDDLSLERTTHAKVYAFIKEIMNDHAQHFDILRKFEQIEAEHKLKLKKSTKAFPESKGQSME